MEDNSISQDEIDALIKAMADKNDNDSGDKEKNINLQSSSKPILSQDEIDALIKVAPSINSDTNLQNKEKTPKTIFSKQRKGNIEIYDFSMPSRLSKDHIKALNTLHGSYAKSLSSYFSISMRTTVDIDCISIEQMNYGEYLSSLFDPTCVGVFSMKPLRGVGIFEINMPLAFPIIDTLLGGSGNPKLYNRNLTVVEESIIRKVMEKALLILQDSWQRSMELKIKLERLENNPQFIQAATAGDPVILILFDVKLENVNGMMSLCFPFLTIQQALANLKKEESPALVDDEAMNLYKDMMKVHVRSINLPVSVRYEPSPVTLGELLKLKKGDIVLLQNAKKDQVSIFIAGKKKFLGKPGMVKGRRAVQLSDNKNEEKSEVV
ncbi:TPA: flagellar motor switch protein FliM [bacterium]|nr:flagellar motor switch protein FliM [bacterium]